MSEVGAQAPPRRELGLNLVESPRRGFGDLENDVPTERGRAVVDVVELRVIGTLFVAVDPELAAPVDAYGGVALVPSPLVLEDGHDAVHVVSLFEQAQRRAVVER